MKNILTIDLEDWYHGLLSLDRSTVKYKKLPVRIKDSASRIIELLEEKKTKATFFVLGEIAEKNPDLVENISKQKHEVAVHGFSHTLANQMTEREFREDIRRARETIKEITKQTPIGYRAPFFSLKRSMAYAFEILAEEGFKYDSSIFPAKTPLYGDAKASRFPFFISGPGWKIKEFPPSTFKIGGLSMPVAGGFYLRSLPVFLIASIIRKINREGFPFILYFHPWEIDDKQPKPEGLSFREKFTHYHNLSLTYNKLKYLLENFEFGSVQEFEKTNGE